MPLAKPGTTAAFSLASLQTACLQGSRWDSTRLVTPCCHDVFGAIEACCSREEDMPTLRKRPLQLTGRNRLRATTPTVPTIADRIAARIMKADEKFDPIL